MTPPGIVLRLNEITEATLTNSVIATKTPTNLTHCRYEVHSEGKQVWYAHTKEDAKESVIWTSVSRYMSSQHSGMIG